MRSISRVVQRAVALAVAAAPSIALVELRCSACDISWQAPRQLNCFENPWTWTTAPIAVGTTANAAACGLTSDASLTTTCASVCGSYGPDCIYFASTNGATIYCTDLSLSNPPPPDAAVEACGRRPRGLVRTQVDRSVGACLARAAWLEAASVIAFDVLHDELVEHRAPRSLRRAARRASRDEERHARMMSRLARRRGARPDSPRCTRRSPRDLVALAVENAVEGCVRETYGAAVALWQAEHAGARDVRAAMRAIAHDEAQHADLGWRVAEWADAKLTDVERNTVLEAGHRAALELIAAASRASGVAELGLPAGPDARVLLQHLWATLWEPAFANRSAIRRTGAA